MSMTRIDAVQMAIHKIDAKSYLEIGTQGDACFSKIVCPNKIGIDPCSGGTHRMTSDAFFHANKTAAVPGFFDVIFIDGDHHHLQVERDIAHSLEVLNPRGMILMHDCNPPNRAHELLNACGSTWRAFAHHRQNLELDAIVGDFDYGVGAIRFQKNSRPITLPVEFGMLTYDDLEAHRSDWMRLSPEAEFIDWMMR